MLKNSVGAFIAFIVSAQVILQGCAVIATCPNSLLPVVEVQVNNSPSNHDDYINTSTYIPCRAKIANSRKIFGRALNFPGGVEVEIRNRNLSTDLTVSPTNAGGSTAFFATLPANGDWFNFFIRGNTVSAVDKAAILELATAGATCNEVVLSRKGLMVSTAAPPIPAAGRPQLEIRVAGISNLDDYITWSPTACYIRWLDPPNAAATLNVSVRNLSPTDHLRFSSTAPAAGATATNTTASLVLTGDDKWGTFYVAGNFGNPSSRDKDAIFEVIETPSNNLLAREGIMVRIRKNVNALTTTADGEMLHYLDALKTVHQTYNLYMLFKESHSQGLPGSSIMHLQAHGGSHFLPWHRAFILHMERLLQASDPSVALPYWNFDQPSPNMYSINGIGRNRTPAEPGDVNWVVLAPGNPISTWQIPGEVVGIRRRTTYGDAGLCLTATEMATMALGINFAQFRTMESVTHTLPHTNSSGSASAGWIAVSQTLASQDPLFYFLHCNVDRLWAKWQWANDRFDTTQVSTYDLLGKFTAPAVPGQRLGRYLDDTMWPWDNVTGGAGLAERPITAPLTPFPITLGFYFPGATPTINNTVDFKLQNFCFDDFNPY